MSPMYEYSSDKTYYCSKCGEIRQDIYAPCMACGHKRITEEPPKKKVTNYAPQTLVVVDPAVKEFQEKQKAVLRNICIFYVLLAIPLGVGFLFILLTLGMACDSGWFCPVVFYGLPVLNVSTMLAALVVLWWDKLKKIKI